MIAVIDYGAGNLRSIQRALVKLGEEPVITGNPEAISAADAVVFPGVGNARAAMDQLNTSGIADAVRQTASAGTPVFGICLGMQLLFGDQEEGPTTGLGLLAGRGLKLPDGLKTPHMGWNAVHFTDNGPFAGQQDETMYFVHSYIVAPDDPSDIAGVTAYGGPFPSVVARDNIWGTQFHPEKSGEVGISLLGTWVDQVRGRTR